jgi:WD40 repeat protein
LQALPNPAGPVRSLFLLADNRTVVAGGDDKAVSIHDVAVTAVLPVQKDGVVGLALHPSAPQAITAGADKTVKLWDLAAGKELKMLATLTEPITSLAVSRDFAAFAVTAGKMAKVWQVADGKELASIAHPGGVVSVGFSGDKSRLITGATDNLARVWEVATGRLLQTFGHAGAIRGVALHPSQPLVVTASADKTAAVHPLALTRITATPKPLRAILATPDSARLVVAGDDGIVRVINASSGAEERKIEGAAGPVYALALSKNGQVLAIAGADKTVRLVTFNDGKEVGTITASAPVRGLALTTDAKLLVGVADDQTVTAWGVAFQPGQPLPEDFGKVVQQFAHGDAALAAAFTDKGELFTGSADKTVRQWRVAANVPTRNFQHPNLVDAVAWSPDGKLLATACHDGIVRVFDVEKNAATKTINAHTTPTPVAVYSITWTADGKQLLSTSYDKSMKLWDATSGSLVKEFKPFAEKGNEKGHTDQVFCAAVTRDGKLIASGGSDRRIKLWNAADGSVVREFPNPEVKGEPGQSHPGGVYQLRFTPDEKYLVSAGPAPRNQGYLAVWNVADGKLVSGRMVSFGPVFGLALTPDGKNVLLSCGPKVRQIPEAEAVLMPLPIK